MNQQQKQKASNDNVGEPNTRKECIAPIFVIVPMTEPEQKDLQTYPEINLQYNTSSEFLSTARVCLIPKTQYDDTCVDEEEGPFMTIEEAQNYCDTFDTIYVLKDDQYESMDKLLLQTHLCNNHTIYSLKIIECERAIPQTSVKIKTLLPKEEKVKNHDDTVENNDNTMKNNDDTMKNNNDNISPEEEETQQEPYSHVKRAKMRGFNAHMATKKETRNFVDLAMRTTSVTIDMVDYDPKKDNWYIKCRQSMLKYLIENPSKPDLVNYFGNSLAEFMFWILTFIFHKPFELLGYWYFLILVVCNRVIPWSPIGRGCFYIGFIILQIISLGAIWNGIVMAIYNRWFKKEKKKYYTKCDKALSPIKGLSTNICIPCNKYGHCTMGVPTAFKHPGSWTNNIDILDIYGPNKKCRQCSAVVPADSKFCGNCERVAGNNRRLTIPTVA